MPMQVLLFGSSFFKYLSYYDKKRVHKVGNTRAYFSYKHFTGKSFEEFMNDADAIDRVLRTVSVPDYVVVHFGGNSISNATTKRVLIDNCTRFYDLLRERLDLVNPNAIIVASPIILRYVYNNRFDTPLPARFNTLRNYVNERMRVLKTVDYMLRTTGPNNFDNKNSLRDNVHLNYDAEKDFLEAIISKIAHIHK